MLTDVYTDIMTLRALTYQTAWRADQGEDIRVEASMIKYCAGEWGFPETFWWVRAGWDLCPRKGGQGRNASNELPCLGPCAVHHDQMVDRRGGLAERGQWQ